MNKVTAGSTAQSFLQLPDVIQEVVLCYLSLSDTCTLIPWDKELERLISKLESKLIRNSLSLLFLQNKPHTCQKDITHFGKGTFYVTTNGHLFLDEQGMHKVTKTTSLSDTISLISGRRELMTTYGKELVFRLKPSSKPPLIFTDEDGVDPTIAFLKGDKETISSATQLPGAIAVSTNVATYVYSTNETTHRILDERKNLLLSSISDQLIAWDNAESTLVIYDSKLNPSTSLSFSTLKTYDIHSIHAVSNTEIILRSKKHIITLIKPSKNESFQIQHPILASQTDGVTTSPTHVCTYLKTIQPTSLTQFQTTLFLRKANSSDTPHTIVLEQSINSIKLFQNLLLISHGNLLQCYEITDNKITILGELSLELSSFIQEISIRNNKLYLTIESYGYYSLVHFSLLEP